MSELLLGAALSLIAAAVTWLVASVLKSREGAIELRGRVTAIEVKASALEAGALTQECVREVVDDALSARDVAAEDRRKQWDETLTLKIEAAVRGAVGDCERNTKAELESMVPRIVREILAGRPRTRSTDRRAERRVGPGKR